MKILLTGAKGQLGYALMKLLGEHDVAAHDVDTLDLTQPDAVAAMMDSFQPDCVINASAYTAVDKAESEPELADAVNHLAVETLAKECARVEARMIHVSTDFVFDGLRGTPYMPNDAPSPVSVYGETKLAGEQAMMLALADKALIIRTAWLYSAVGNNFAKTMIRLMKEKDSLNVVADQIGTPTSANGLAQVIVSALDKPDANGIYHWTDAGAASWYDFAVAIQDEALALGLLQHAIPVAPIPTSAYPTPARRPHYSVLDKQSSYDTFGVPAVHWRVQLREVLKELKELAQQES